jgi:hypothetical protein
MTLGSSPLALSECLRKFAMAVGEGPAEIPRLRLPRVVVAVVADTTKHGTWRMTWALRSRYTREKVVQRTRG